MHTRNLCFHSAVAGEETQRWSPIGTMPHGWCGRPADALDASFVEAVDSPFSSPCRGTAIYSENQKGGRDSISTVFLLRRLRGFEY